MFEDECDSEFEESDEPFKDKNTLVMSVDISDACEDEEERLEEIEEYEDEVDMYKTSEMK